MRFSFAPPFAQTLCECALVCSRLFKGATQTCGFVPLPCRLVHRHDGGLHSTSMSCADVYLRHGVYHWQVVWSEDKAHSPVVSMGVACPDLLDRQGNAQGCFKMTTSCCNCSHHHFFL